VANRPEGYPFLPNRNRVFVVDDDPGMLRGVKRLLRQHGYDSVLFASAEAFENHNDFESAICIILDICWEFRAGHLHNWERHPCRSDGCASIRMPRLSRKTILGEVADGAHRESIG
jgi:DNA-binding NtrC family response regulator